MEFDPKVKPRLWNLSTGIVAHNCRKYGFPLPYLAIPTWEMAGDLARDYGGGNHHGTIADAQKWVTGGIAFNGTDDLITCSPVSTPNGITFGAWVQSDNFNQRGAIILKKPYNEQWEIFFYDNDVLYLRGGGNSYISLTISDYFINTNTHHVAATISGTVGKIYVDGRERASGTVDAIQNGMTPGTNDILIGDLGTAGYEYDGIINNPHIFPALNPTQMQFLSDNPYFMYQIPEELYGYVAGAPETSIPALMNYYRQLRAA